MKFFTKSIMLLTAFIFCMSGTYSQVRDNYIFSQSVGSYSLITATGTDIINAGQTYNGIFKDIPIGFDFVFNNQTFSTFTVTTNGFIQLGTSTLTNTVYTPISSPGANVLSINGIQGYASSSTAGASAIEKQVTGSAPYRTLTVQWRNYRENYNTNPSSWNMQIVLFETTNQIQFRYINCTGNYTGTQYFTTQVGIKGNEGDYSTRTAASSWASTTTGYNLIDHINTAIPAPPNGLTFTWSRAIDPVVSINSTKTGVPPGESEIILRTTVLPANAGSSSLDVTSMTFNASGTTNPADIVSAKLYYTPNDAFSNANQFGSTILGPLSGEFTFTGLKNQTSPGYYWLVYECSSGASIGNTLSANFVRAVAGGNTILPSALNSAGSLTVRNAVKGTYLIGPGQTGDRAFASLSNAFAYLNTTGIDGNTTLLISESYAEPTSPVTLIQYPENCVGAGSYALTITTSGDYTVSGGASTKGVINICGADRVKIDGRINASGSGRHLTLRNTGTVTNTYVINVFGVSTTDMTVRNCVIYSDNNWLSTDANKSYCLFMNGNGFNNISILNNEIKGSSYGIYLNQTYGGLTSNAVISGNTIGGNTSAEYITYYGCYLYSLDNLTFTGNEIFNVKTSSTFAYAAYGIYMGSVTNSVFSNNKIHGIYQRFTGLSNAYGAFGIYALNNAYSNSIINNSIYDIHTANGYNSASVTTNCPIGIFISVLSSPPSNWKVYNNSIHLYGAQLVSTRPVAERGSHSYCMMINGNNPLYMDIRNNVFSNEMIAGPTDYHICVVNTNNAGTNSLMYSAVDNNVYWLGGNTPGTNFYVGSLGTVKYNTLSDWRTTFTGGKTGAVEYNSVFGDPVFTYADNLIPTGTSSAAYMAQSLSVVQTDILGNSRGLYPSAGAYNYSGAEKVPPPVLILPADNAYCQPVKPVMTWENVAGASSYVLQYSTSPIFADASELPVATNSYTVPDDNLCSLSAKYYWRVKSISAASSALQSSWSVVHTFNIVGAPSTPVTASPLANTDISQKQTFSWSDTPGATRYSLEFSLSPSFSTIYASVDNIGTNSYLYSFPTPNISVYWRVKAYSDCSMPVQSSVSDVRGPEYVVSGFVVSQVGNGSVITTGGNTPDGYSNGARSQWIITASELNQAGIYGPGIINQLQYYVTSIVSSAIDQTFNIEMKNTTQSIMSSSTSDYTGFTLCSTTPQIPVMGWNVYNFSNPFIWDGTSNVMLSICKYNTVSGAPSYSVKGTNISSISRYSTSTAQICTSGGSSSVGYFRPDFKFSGITPWTPPVLVMPANSAVNVDTLGTSFSWQSVPGATNYSFQLSTDSSFATTIEDVQNLTGLTRVIAIPQLSAVTRYYWRLKAFNGIQETKWSDRNYFDTKGIITKPSLIQPYNKLANIYENNAYFEWMPSRGAASYTIQISTENQFTSSNKIEIVTPTPYYTLTQPELVQNTTYYWRVKGGNTVTESDWSDTWAFTTRTPQDQLMPFFGIQIGNGTGITTGAGGIDYGDYAGHIVQYLITRDELNAQGIVGPGTITQLQYNVIGQDRSATNEIFGIKMKSTDLASFASSLIDADGYTLCYNTPYRSVVGWNVINFTAPFVWDGSSNVIVSIGRYLPGIQNGPKNYIQFNSTVNQFCRYYWSDTLTNPLNYSGFAYITNLRANLKFSGTGYGSGFVPTPMKLIETTVSQPLTSNTFQGSPRQAVAAYKVWMNGTQSPMNLTSITLGTAGTTSLTDITNARLWFTGSDSVLTQTNAVQFGTTIASPGAVMTFTGAQGLSASSSVYFGKKLADAEWNYFWLTYDVATTAIPYDIIDAQGVSSTIASVVTSPLVANPDGNRKILRSLYGEYTVGNTPGATFPNFKTAFDTINTYALRDNIVLKVVSDVAEPSASVLNSVKYTGTSAYTITIKPDASTMRTVSGTFGGDMITFNNADNIIIDGRPTLSGSTGYLTFSGSIGTQNNNNTLNFIGSDNSSLRYLTIKGDRIYNNTDGSPSCAVKALNSNNFTFTNNKVSRSDFGLLINGQGTSGNVSVQNNIIGGSVPAEYLGRVGIKVCGTTGGIVKNNTVMNIKSINGAIAQPYVNGICAGDTGTGKTVNLTITGNRINTLYNNYPNGGAVTGINLYNAESCLISNNAIYDILNKGNISLGGTTESGPIGISQGSLGQSNSIVFNSVNMTGVTVQQSASAAVYFNSSAADFVLTDNAFVNSISGPGGSKSYSYYKAGSPSFRSSDYNNFYSSGANAVAGYSAGSDKTSWQSLYSSIHTGTQNENSFSSDPKFIADNNLALQVSSPMAFAAVPMSDVVEDCQNAARNAEYPSIGAYELNSSQLIPTPRLVYPNNYANPFNQGDSLQWSRVNEAYVYSLQVSTDSLFTSPATVSINTNKYTVLTNPGAQDLNLLPSTCYWWRVKASTSSGISSVYSRVRQFISGGELGVPTGVSPSEGLAVVNPELTWTAVTGATEYDVQVSTNPNFSPVIYGATVTGLYCTPSDLPLSQVLYWRVRGVRYVGETAQKGSWFAPERSFVHGTLDSTNSQSFDQWRDTVLLPSGWAKTGYSGSQWRSVNAGINPPADPYTGTGLLEYNTSGNPSGNSGTLISPRINYTGRNGEAAALTLMMNRHNFNAAYQGSTLQVYVNNKPTLDSGAVLLLGTLNSRYPSAPAEQSQGWYRYSYDLPFAYNGSAYFIFKAVSDGSNNVQLDDIKWTQYSSSQSLPGSPKLISPADSATGQPVTVDLHWRAVQNAESYVYQISTSDNFAEILSEGSTSGLMQTVSGLSENSDYYWRVKSVNTTSGTESGWSAKYKFTTITYCFSSVINACNDEYSHITGVTLGVNGSNIMTNASDCPINSRNINGYSDYSGDPSITASVTRGQMLTVSVSKNNNPDLVQMGDQVVVFFDWNADGDLNDLGALDSLALTSDDYNFNFTGSIQVPANAHLGNIRMRVKMIGIGTLPPEYYMTPCNPDSGPQETGEIEDYSVKVLPIIRTITTGQLSGSYCENSTVSVPFTLSGAGEFESGNSFAAVLYNADNDEYIIGTLDGTTSGTISCRIPSGITPGTYRIKVESTNPVSVSSNNNGSDLSVNRLPAKFDVSTSVSTACAGDNGTMVLSSSETGKTYRLTKDNAVIGSGVQGTGSSLSINTSFNTNGTSVYGIIATDNVTGCSTQMNNAVSVETNPLPSEQQITAGGIPASNAAYCENTSGVRIGLASSESGVIYSLILNGTENVALAVGSSASGPISFGAVNTAGTYTVTANYPNSACTKRFDATFTLYNEASPVTYDVIASDGGSYCDGSDGANISLSGSQAGVAYRVQLQGTDVTLAESIGTGLPLLLGKFTSGTYAVYAYGTNCSSAMNNAATITKTPLAAPQLTAPADNASGLTGTQELAWNPAGNCATGYAIQISTDALFATTVVDARIVGTSYSFADAAFGKRYYWRVKTLNGAAEGNYSSANSFAMRAGAVQSINLSQGWNAVSSYVIPAQTSPSAVFAGISADVALVMNKNQVAYTPADVVPAFVWSPGEAYYVYMNRPAVLTFAGEKANPADYPVTLTQGWNFIPYPESQEMPVSTALASIADKLVIVTDQIDYFGTVFGLNSLQTMKPGKGYFVYVKQACTLVYPNE